MTRNQRRRQGTNWALRQAIINQVVGRTGGRNWMPGKTGTCKVLGGREARQEPGNREGRNWAKRPGRNQVANKMGIRQEGRQRGRLESSCAEQPLQS